MRCFRCLKDGKNRLRTPVQGTADNRERLYRLAFVTDGTVMSLFDKALGRELLEKSAPYRCNQFVYTKDANKTFISPSVALFQHRNFDVGADGDRPHGRSRQRGGDRTARDAADMRKSASTSTTG
jgi:hypothetical protein